jgi:hypothetical protein
MDQYGKYKRVVVEKDDGTSVPEDEPVFVLRAQDVLAPIAVRFYASLVAAVGDPMGAGRIESFADRMAAWPTKKLPD